MSVIATGNYTIVDYNDAPMLYGWISVEGSKTQGYTPDIDMYIPDYTLTPLRITASLFSAGTSDDLLLHPEGIISNMQWKVANSKGVVNEIVGATQRSYLINTNLTDDTSKTYIFTCTYTQPASQLSLPVEINVEINKVINGTGIADAVILAPNGNIFKNDNHTHLDSECQLWCGSSINTEITGDNFKWWKMDATGTGGGHGIGEGWKLLTHGVDDFSIVFNNHKSVISIPKSSVVSSEVFMCTVQDSCDNKIYKETIVFMDTTDPIFISIDSSGGNAFKDGIGYSMLTAMLFQNGQEIDPLKADGGQQKYTYKWYKYDKNGNLVGPNGARIPYAIDLLSVEPYGVGKQLEVTGDDVDEKATFRCDIS